MNQTNKIFSPEKLAASTGFLLEDLKVLEKVAEDEIHALMVIQTLFKAKLPPRWLSDYLTTMKRCKLSKIPDEHLISKKNISKRYSSTVSGKPGRNDICFCGSGKKFKKCCIKK